MRVCFFLVLLLTLCAWNVQAHNLAHHAQAQTVTSLAQAERYLTAYRETGDDSLLQAVGEYFAASDAPGTAQAALLQVWHAQAEHRFHDASRMLQPLLAEDEPALWLLQANLRRVVGDYAQSERACRRTLKHSVLLGKACLMQADIGRGNRPDRAALKQLLSLHTLMAERSSTDAPTQAWLASVLADAHTALGQQKSALHWSAQALSLQPTVQHQALHGALLLQAGKSEAVLELIPATASAPALRVLYLQTMLQLNRRDEVSAMIHAAHHEFQHHIRQQDFLHAREMAQFYLHVLPKPALARQLAQENWARQKEPEDRELLQTVEAT